MKNNTTRVTAVVGTTMALVIAGTAAVAAAGPRDRDDSRGFGKMGPGAQQGAKMPGARAMGGMMGGMGGGMRGLDADFERTERTVQTADGTTVRRVEQGVVDSAAADSLDFTLGSGEAVTVVIDDDTTAVAFEEQEVTSRRGQNRTRMAPTEVGVEEIEAGVEVVVWSDSEDDSEFVATRIAIRPTEAEEDTDGDEAAEAEAEEAVEEAEDVEETTEDAATTDA